MKRNAEHRRYTGVPSAPFIRLARSLGVFLAVFFLLEPAWGQSVRERQLARCEVILGADCNRTWGQIEQDTSFALSMCYPELIRTDRLSVLGDQIRGCGFADRRVSNNDLVWRATSIAVYGVCSSETQDSAVDTLLELLQTSVTLSAGDLRSSDVAVSFIALTSRAFFSARRTALDCDFDPDARLAMAVVQSLSQIEAIYAHYSALEHDRMVVEGVPEEEIPEPAVQDLLDLAFELRPRSTFAALAYYDSAEAARVSETTGTIDYDGLYAALQTVVSGSDFLSSTTASAVDTVLADYVLVASLSRDPQQALPAIDQAQQLIPPAQWGPSLTMSVRRAYVHAVLDAFIRNGNADAVLAAYDDLMVTGLPASASWALSLERGLLPAANYVDASTMSPYRAAIDAQRERCTDDTCQQTIARLVASAMRVTSVVPTVLPDFRTELADALLAQLPSGHPDTIAVQRWLASDAREPLEFGDSHVGGLWSLLGYPLLASNREQLQTELDALRISTGIRDGFGLNAEYERTLSEITDALLQDDPRQMTSACRGARRSQSFSSEQLERLDTMHDAMMAAHYPLRDSAFTSHGDGLSLEVAGLAEIATNARIQREYRPFGFAGLFAAHYRLGRHVPGLRISVSAVSGEQEAKVVDQRLTPPAISTASVDFTETSYVLAPEYAYQLTGGRTGFSAGAWAGVRLASRRLGPVEGFSSRDQRYVAVFPQFGAKFRFERVLGTWQRSETALVMRGVWFFAQVGIGAEFLRVNSQPRTIGIVQGLLGISFDL